MGIKVNVPLPSLGLVVDRPGEFVDARAVANIKNMEFNRSIIRKRIGTSALGTTLGERVQRLFELQVGASTRLFRIGLTKVEVYNKNTNTWSSAAHAVLTGGESDMVSYAFPVLSGSKIAVFTNGIDAIRKCGVAGVDAVLGGSPPKARFARNFGAYLVLGSIIDGGSDFRSRLQWCDTGLPETWSGGNAGSQDLLEDPEDITGLGVFGGFLTVHKSRSIYLGQLVSTSEVFRFERRATGVGACAEATIQNIPSGEQIFLATDGIHLFNGITAPLIDSPIQDELRETMNPAYLYKAQSVFVPELDEYWVAVPIGSDTEPQTIYKYNWRTKQLYKDYRANLTSLGIFLNTQEDVWNDHGETWDSNTQRWDAVTNLSLNPVVILGDSTGITTKRTSASNNDNGTAVEAIWETKDFTAMDAGLPDMDRLMRWKGLEIWAKGSSVKVYYSTDEGTTWTLAKTMSLSSEYQSDSAPGNVFFNVVSSKIRFRLVNNTAGESFTLKKYQIEAIPREARK
jgi:hypothetical protein